MICIPYFLTLHLKNIQKYSDYLIDNYVSENLLFIPYLWDENLAELTTNASESFHKHFSHFLCIQIFLFL